MNREKADVIKKRLADFSGMEERAVKRPTEGDIHTRKVSIGRAESNVQKMRRDIQSAVANGIRLSTSICKLEEGAFCWELPASAREIREKQKEIVKNIAATKKSLEENLNNEMEASEIEKDILVKKFRLMAEEVGM